MALPFIACLGYVQTVEGEGMPIFSQHGHGNLFIEYNVVLPVELGPEMRQSKFHCEWETC